MKAFGLTGNIGCGKSTVAALLSKYPHVMVLDCDRSAKAIVSDAQYGQELKTILGADVFNSGDVDFKVIARIIFTDPEKKKLIEAFIHPKVWAMVEEKVNSAGDEMLCIVESAIIYETSSENKFMAMIAVVCSPDEQLRRLREDRRMSDTQIQARLDEQLPMSQKELQAQLVINTDCSRDELENRVSHLYQKLKQLKGT